MMLAMACLMQATAMLVQPERCFLSLVESLNQSMPVVVYMSASWALD